MEACLFLTRLPKPVMCHHSLFVRKSKGWRRPHDFVDTDDADDADFFFFFLLCPSSFVMLTIPLSRNQTRFSMSIANNLVQHLSFSSRRYLYSDPETSSGWRPKGLKSNKFRMTLWVGLKAKWSMLNGNRLDETLRDATLRTMCYSSLNLHFALWCYPSHWSATLRTLYYSSHMRATFRWRYWG